MANAIFAYQDLSLYTLSATSTDSSFPLTNIQTYFADQVWKSASTAANQTLVIDFGAVKTCDFLVLDGFASGNADSVVLEADTVSNFASAVTVIAAGIIDPSLTPTSPAYFSFSSTSKRYWRLRYVLSAGSLAAVPYVGNLYLGAKMDFGYAYSFPYKNTNRSYETVEKKALDGRIRTSQPYAGRKTWEFDITTLPDATKVLFQTFFQTVRGKMRPFYFVDFDGVTVTLVHLDTDVDPSQTIRYNINDIKKIVLKSQLVS